MQLGCCCPRKNRCFHRHALGQHPADSTASAASFIVYTGRMDPATSLQSTREHLASLNSETETYAAQFVNELLESAHRLSASDVHLRPNPDGIEIAVRIDGVLQPCGNFSRGKVSDIVTRLKVLSELLTYKTDVPQEGRVRNPPFAAEIRVSSFPTLHGEQAVVRLFAAEARYQFLDNLGLPGDVYGRLKRLIDETSGAILITGPAGSGKTTTAYACLRELVRHPAEVAVSRRSKTRWKRRSAASHNHKSIPAPGSIWPWVCGRCCGKTQK